MYSNSKNDIDRDTLSAVSDESAVRAMYERDPYPGLGAGLKDISFFTDPIAADLAKRKLVRFLDAGCGTGHYLVGVAKKYPNWDCFGIDLSAASLQVASDLAKLHKANVSLRKGSYLKPLPFEGQFDVIAALGTIHHAAEPVVALRTLHAALRDDGYLLGRVPIKQAARPLSNACVASTG